MLQAVINEDTSGDAALLKSEILRLKEELALYRTDAAQQKVQSNALCILENGILLFVATHSSALGSASQQWASNPEYKCCALNMLYARCSEAGNASRRHDHTAETVHSWFSFEIPIAGQPLAGHGQPCFLTGRCRSRPLSHAKLLIEACRTRTQSVSVSGAVAPKEHQTMICAELVMYCTRAAGASCCKVSDRVG